RSDQRAHLPLVSREHHEREHGERELEAQDHLAQHEQRRDAVLAEEVHGQQRGDDRDEPRDQPSQPRTEPDVEESFHHDLAGKRTHRFSVSTVAHRMLPAMYSIAGSRRTSDCGTNPVAIPSRSGRANQSWTAKQPAMPRISATTSTST